MCEGVCEGVCGRGCKHLRAEIGKNSTTENGKDKKDKKAFSGANAIPHTQILSMLRL